MDARASSTTASSTSTSICVGETLASSITSRASGGSGATRARTASRTDAGRASRVAGQQLGDEERIALRHLVEAARAAARPPRHLGDAGARQGRERHADAAARRQAREHAQQRVIAAERVVAIAQDRAARSCFRCAGPGSATGRASRCRPTAHRRPPGRWVGSDRAASRARPRARRRHGAPREPQRRARAACDRANRPEVPEASATASARRSPTASRCVGPPRRAAARSTVVLPTPASPLSSTLPPGELPVHSAAKRWPRVASSGSRSSSKSSGGQGTGSSPGVCVTLCMRRRRHRVLGRTTASLPRSHHTAASTRRRCRGAQCFDEAGSSRSCV